MPQSDLINHYLKKLDEASNLSILAEAMLDAGEYTSAAAYNVQAKNLQDEVKEFLSKS